MALSASLAAKIAKAKTTGGGNIIKDGKYLLEIARLLIDSKYSGTCFIAEHIVRQSAPNHTEPDGKVVIPNEVGSTCSYVVNLDTNKSAAGNTKAYVLALFGIKEDEMTYESNTFNVGGLPGDNGAVQPDRFVPVTAGALMTEEHREIEIMKTIAELVSENQPGRGMLIGDTTFRKPIKGGPNAGKPFTGHNWFAIDQTDEEIAARRKAQDTAPAKAA